MKRIGILFFALMLAASALADVPLFGSANGGAIILGTLADAHNPVEMAVAPEYTRLAVLRQRTANRLHATVANFRIPADRLRGMLEAANQIQRLADEARKELDDASGRKEPNDEFHRALDRARAMILAGERLYDERLAGK